jgi:hypothetical protein
MGHREDLEKFKKKLEAAMNVIRKKEVMTAIGQNAADQIKLRTRLGYGVNENEGERQKLRPLSKSYKLQRAGKLGFFTTKTGVVVPYTPQEGVAHIFSDQTSPSKSNLTRTGEMLDSMTATFKSEGIVSIGPSGSRKDGSSNDIVAQYAHESGRNFNYLSKNEIAKVTQFVNRLLKQILKAFD